MSALSGTAWFIWDRFIEETATAVEKLHGRFSRKRTISFVETAPGHFIGRRDDGDGSNAGGSISIDENNQASGDGAREMDSIKRASVDLIFLPDRFLIRDLPFPAQASAFLRHIIQNQIDRLTPWANDKAIFGFVTKESTPSRILVSVAAADQRKLEPLIDAFLKLKPRVLRSFVGASEKEGTPRIPLFVERGGGVSRLLALRRLLSSVLIMMGIGVGADTAYSIWQRSRLDALYETTQAEIARQRDLFRVAGATDIETSLFAKKRSAPVATLVIENLAKALPDDTYLTALEMDGNTIHATGLSRDATILIGLLEKSPDLSDASFYAPTTRGATDQRERFHIAVKIKPRMETVP